MKLVSIKPSSNVDKKIMDGRSRRTLVSVLRWTIQNITSKTKNLLNKKEKVI